MLFIQYERYPSDATRPDPGPLEMLIISLKHLRHKPRYLWRRVFVTSYFLTVISMRAQLILSLPVSVAEALTSAAMAILTMIKQVLGSEQATKTRTGVVRC